VAEVGKRVLESLERLDQTFERIEIDPEYADTADFCSKYGYKMDACGNTIVIASKSGPKRFSACVVRGVDRLDVNHTVRNLMEVSRISFASPADTIELTGMEIGGVTVFNLPAHVPIYVDSKIAELDYVILGSGDRSSKTKSSPQVFRKLGNVKVIKSLSM
jgi:prolyl-tRNA editing enzyme YbaK/EbsC (Cys-tRNA(Pro) deacylase)